MSGGWKIESLSKRNRVVPNAEIESFSKCPHRSATLEYKASPAVSNEEPRKSEVAKVVSAIASASGGQIVYGMTEKDHQCAGSDEGIDPLKYNGRWFEQVIQQNVRPRIEGLQIHPVPLGSGNNAYVLTIPAAQSRAPHQLVMEWVYYRRRNFRNDKMEDYEIREAMNRARTPERDVLPAFKGQLQADHSLIHSTNGGRSDGIDLDFIVSNVSNQPAECAALIVGVDLDIQIVGNENFAFYLGVHTTQTSTQTIRAVFGFQRFARG